MNTHHCSLSPKSKKDYYHNEVCNEYCTWFAGHEKDDNLMLFCACLIKPPLKKTDRNNHIKKKLCVCETVLFVLRTALGFSTLSSTYDYILSRVRLINIVCLMIKFKFRVQILLFVQTERVPALNVYTYI